MNDSFNMSGNNSMLNPKKEKKVGYYKAKLSNFMKTGFSGKAKNKNKVKYV